MSNNLQSIMIDLKNATDEHENVIDINKVCKAIDRLEVFPMSMVQLQETRIGQLLQAIRHKVELTLQKRIRAIIKAWQKLLLPGQAHATIIPLQVEHRTHSSTNLTEHLNCSTSSPSGINNSSSNSSVNNFDHTPAGVHVTSTALRSSSSVAHNAAADKRAGDTPDLSHTRPPYPPDRLPLTPSKHADPDVVNRVLRDPIPKAVISPCANKHALSKANGSSHLVVASPKLNGRTTSSSAVARSQQHASARPPAGPPSEASSEATSHDTANQLHERRPGTTHHRLAKVKSTAELIRAAEGCLDSSTVDRILSNRIAKESDEPPRIVPQTAVRSTRQSKNAPHALNKSATVAAIGRSASGDVPTAKSEMMAKFLESTVMHHQQTELKTRIPEMPVSGGGSSSRIGPTGPRSPLPRESDRLVSTPQPADSAYSGDDLDAMKKQHKDRKRHKHRHHADPSSSDHVSKHHRKRSTTAALPPISNRMNEWPELPPLPRDVEMSPCVAATGDGVSAPTSPELRDIGNVERLMSGSWVGVNAVLDGEQNPQPMTALYSVGLDEDNLVHVLPWVNLNDYQRTFFPSDSSELERLSKLPDPW